MNDCGAYASSVAYPKPKSGVGVGGFGEGVVTGGCVGGFAVAVGIGVAVAGFFVGVGCTTGGFVVAGTCVGDLVFCPGVEAPALDGVGVAAVDVTETSAVMVGVGVLNGKAGVAALVGMGAEDETSKSPVGVAVGDDGLLDGTVVTPQPLAINMTAINISNKNRFISPPRNRPLV